MDNISFQPDLEKLKSTTVDTHFILSGYLRNSMTFKTYHLGMQHYHIKANYLPYELPVRNQCIDREAVKNFLDIFRTNDNLKTILVSCPYKQVIIDYLDEVSPEAKIIGGVNFVLKKNNQLFGEHLDAKAFLMAVEEEIHFDFQNASMLFFGCGGVSSAIALKLAPRLKKIGLVDVDKQKADSLCEKLRLHYPNLSVISFDRTSPLNFTAFDVFYNGTGLGKFSHDPQSINCTPVLEGDIFPAVGLAIDANYRPWETVFLKDFAKLGYQTLNGFGHMIASSAIHLSMMSSQNVDFLVLKDMIQAVD